MHNLPFVKSIETAFRNNADKSIATKQSAYLKNHFPFLGLMQPVRKALQREVFQKFPLDSEEDLKRILFDLWQKEEREFQYAACDLAIKYSKLCSPNMLGTFEKMIREKSWWDTVDTVASNLIGELLKENPLLKPKMHLWVYDPHLWIRRSALLFQLKFKEKTDEKRLFDYCESLMHEKEFFIQKAIGWVLREYSKTAPLKVGNFISENKLKLSNLSIKEGSKYL
ncbi:MAG: DNA alkylation repair protein [Simkaniaceae bacterium]|nr:DNA alkylation repair protein [Simkaniaceae bacterium]